MCGLTGFLAPGGFEAGSAHAALAAMSQALRHRGPDDDGQWLDATAGIALGHRRLAILDLSAAGHQPMLSGSGRYVLVLNGEIYNHLELRAQLNSAGPAPAWRGHSDTESLLAGFDAWGIDATLAKSVGMFAFAVWDREQRTLTLARDRLGEKPLYYGWQGGVLLFGSELKSLRVHPRWRAQIDRASLAAFLRRGFIAAPRSIYEQVYKLPPGTSLRFSADPGPAAAGTGAYRDAVPRAYWSLRETVAAGRAQPFSGGPEEAAAELLSLLQRSVALQSIADVSLGAFLSGGVDSSLVVALLQSGSSRPVKTFTIGFREARFDEAPHARAVAAHLSTEHTELMVSAADAQRVIPQLPRIYDEPFGDSSAIPTVLVSQLARSQVTVSLSGDGGDELFGGYGRYQRTADIWRRVASLPRSLRAPAAAFARAAAPAAGRHAPLLRRGASYLRSESLGDCYAVQFSQDAGEPCLVSGIESGEMPAETIDPADRPWDPMMFEDTTGYLPDDILVKVDRAAMAVSLESRVPLLDHRIVEFAWRLPPALKVREGQGKWLLKKLLRERVPASLIDRPKMGFGVPVGDWLRGPLRDWGESLLSAPRLRAQGLLDVARVRARWQQFQQGGRISSDAVWPLLMFEAWLESGS